MKYGYIYITTNEENGKRYVGQSTRYDAIDSYYGSGKLMKRALEKYGKTSFKKKVLVHCHTQEELDQYEKGYIKLYKPDYNLDKGGSAGKHSDETKLKMRKPKSKAHREKMIGRIVSDETKRKISEAHTGKKRSEEAKANYRKAKRHVSEESRRKMSLAKMGNKNAKK